MLFVGIAPTTSSSSTTTASTDSSSTESPFQDHPVHWILSESNRGVVEAEDTKFPKLHLSGDGVTFRNGHAILDGESGYFDGGDYRGECFSGKLRRSRFFVYLSNHEDPFRKILSGAYGISSD